MPDCISRDAHRSGRLAQLGERRVRNAEVRSSILLPSTNFPTSVMVTCRFTVIPAPLIADGVLRNRELLILRINFSTQSVRQDKHRISMAKVHARHYR
jgi:hypothetical protein